MNEEPLLQYKEFPKIPRLFSGDVVITEKIDGSNAQIYVTDTGIIMPGSRTRWLTPENDNYGFCRWALQNKEELLKLGPGHHYGEWWGCGINRGYDLHERRFWLFNVSKWSDPSVRPACCGVVPVLETHEKLDTKRIQAAAESLRAWGSKAVPGYMKPEGIVVYHSRANQLFKVLLENDELPKGKRGPNATP